MIISISMTVKLSKDNSMKIEIANLLTKVFIIILLCSTIFAAETTPEVKPFTYKTIGDRELKIYIHYPPGWKASDSRPGIIFFFGGGWAGGRIEQFLPQAEYLAGRGMVAARADYRVKSHDGVTPDKCVEDARSAMRWMRKNAAKLGMDPKKLIASGGSAGGHLAACTMIPKSVDADGDDLSISTIPQAMVLFNPMLSFENEQLLKRLNGDKQLARKISPIRYLDKNSPPAIILFGTKDRLKVHGDEYWKKARAVGVRADEFLAEGQGHGFFNRSPWLERTLIATDKFLTSLGYLKGESTIEAP
jgi:acetyl esterase